MDISASSTCHTCLARIHIRLILQIGNVRRKVAAGWRDTELVFEQQLFLELCIIFTELGDRSPTKKFTLRRLSCISEAVSGEQACCTPLLDKELLSFGKYTVLALPKG